MRQPGIPLLAELIALVRERPDITTGGLLEHFEGREEFGHLQKLAAQDMPGEEDKWRDEFLDATGQLERQTLQQRVDELKGKLLELGRAALSPEEFNELKELQMKIARRN